MANHALGSKETKRIDATCDHDFCNEGTYIMNCSCSNCGWSGTAEITKGHDTMSIRHRDCPRCGCREVRASTYVTQGAAS